MTAKPKYPTMDEREPSDCARRTENGKGTKRGAKGMYWKGMNERDETDETTHQPVGRMISEGFRMLADDDVRDD